jgi:hypothetical protein
MTYKTSKLCWIALAAVTAVGCRTSDGDTVATTEPVAGASSEHLQTAEETALLSFVNDQKVATLDVLDVDCAIRSDAAGNIVAHRDGGAGAADDNLFNDVAELDSVSRVGDKTIEALTACAESLGYLPTSKQLALVNFLNSVDTTVERLDDDCALRSDGAGNLIAHRDGADGMAGTTDDDPFHSEAEVDAVAQIGNAALDLLHACAASFGYGDLTWSPIAVTCAFTNVDPSLMVSQQPDGVIVIDHNGASQGAAVTIGFDDQELAISKGANHFGMYKLSKLVPDGYGGTFVGNDLGIESFLITRDPVGTLTTAQALDVAREGLVAYVRDVRMYESDWQSTMEIATWAEAISLGVMDGIDGFGDLTYDPYSETNRNADNYVFYGSGPFMLYTEVHVSKATGEADLFYVEID